MCSLCHTQQPTFPKTTKNMKKDGTTQTTNKKNERDIVDKRRNVVTPLIQHAVVAVINSCDNRNIIPINKQC